MTSGRLLFEHLLWQHLLQLGAGVQAIVNYKWSQFALKLLYVQLAMFSVWLLSFTVFTKLFQVPELDMTQVQGWTCRDSRGHHPKTLRRLAPEHLAPQHHMQQSACAAATLPVVMGTEAGLQDGLVRV